MPVVSPASVHRISQEEFGDVSYQVMEHVFAIHEAYGRFFDEAIYKRELQRRMTGVQLEVPVDVVFGSFSKRYFLDVLVGQGAVFEFKATRLLTERHKSQLLNYLMLTGLAHGRLITTRAESVGYHFVNSRQTAESRRQFTVERDNCSSDVPNASAIEDLIIAVLQDWGTGLDITLYEEVLTHHLGGEDAVLTRLPVTAGPHAIGGQTLRLAAPGVAFKVTAMGAAKHGSFLQHSRKFMLHTGLQAILWINIIQGQLRIETIR